MDGIDPFLVVEVVHDDVALEVCSDGVGELAGQGLLHQPGGGTALMSVWFAWEGLSVESRNCLESIMLWSFTGMHLASE